MAATAGTTTTTLTTLVREKFVGPFESLRDTRNTFLARVEKVKCGKASYDWLLEDATYSAIWSALEAAQLGILDSTRLATDGVGDATKIFAPGTHPVLKPTVTMRSNYFAVQASGTAIDAMTGGENSYVDAWLYETKKAMQDYWREQNRRALLSSTTVGNSGADIDQIGVLFRTGAVSYAGISAATYPAWAVASDTATTQLSVASLQTGINKIEGGTEILNDQVSNNTIRDSTVKEIWTGPAQADNIFNLMSGFRRFGPDDTLDPGGADIGDSGLRFKGRKIYSIPRFPTGWLIMYTGGLLWAELRALDTMDKSDSTNDSKLMIGVNRANLVLRQRRQFVMTALT